MYLTLAYYFLSRSSHHSLLRPSFSEPNLRQDSSNTAHGLNISSLRAILYDEHGSVLVSLQIELCQLKFV